MTTDNGPYDPLLENALAVAVDMHRDFGDPIIGTLANYGYKIVKVEDATD